VTNPLVSRAVIGDDNAADVLRQAGIQSMQTRAAILPAETRSEPKPLDEQVFRVEEAESLTIAAHERNLRKFYVDTIDLDEYGIWEKYLPRINGVVEMPVMPIVRSTWVLYEAFKFANGLGWIAGSAALWAVTDDKWMFNDIDIFAYTPEAYEELLRKMDFIAYSWSEKGKRQKKFYDCMISLAAPAGLANINIINPTDSDWTNPIEFLKNFDWTIAAVALCSEKSAYAYSIRDIRAKRLSLLSSQYPETIVYRMLKYVQRGFELRGSVLTELLNDEQNRFTRDLRILAQSANIESKTLEFIHRMVTPVTSDGGSDQRDY
jgi:hypothetical protein